jgi:alpha-L-fucosidase
MLRNLHWGPWSKTFWGSCGWSYRRGKLSTVEYRKKLGDWGVKGCMNGRDLLNPYVEACRKHDIKVGLYFSQIDWFWCPDKWPYPGYPNIKNKPENGPPAFEPDNKEEYAERLFKENVYPAVEELMTRYGKIDLMWFDGFHYASDLHPFKLEKIIRTHQPDILINPRYHRDIGQYNTAENHFPKKRPAPPWEFCRSIRGAWGACRPGNRDSGTPTAMVLATLAKCRSWGGVYLANVGPMPDGTMPSYYYKLCKELQGWMKHSREAVEGVGPGPWPEKSNVPATTADGAKTWYLFGWPQDEKGQLDLTLQDKQDKPFDYQRKPASRTLVVKGVDRPRSAVLLHSGRELEFDYRDKALTIVIPAQLTTKLVDVVKVQWPSSQ